MLITLLLLLQLRVPDAAQFVGPPRGTPVTGPQLAQRTEEVAGLLRCPTCQGMSVADSRAEIAINMKKQVRELLARGYSEEQILKYFELAYGGFVLLRPKFEGASTAIWLLPIAAMLIGVALVFYKLRKLEAPTPVAPSPVTDDPYLSRVRDLVGGDRS